MNPNELKSAEEWDKDGKLGSCANVQIIKEIQLNAYKAGMTEAAEIAVNGSIRSPSIAGLILSARDRKENL